MPLPVPFLAHLRSEGYNARSNKHSNALALAIVEDLTAYCPLLGERGVAGRVVYQLNFDLVCGSAQWNIDLVLGAPPLGTPPPPDGKMLRVDPSTVEVAIEIKAVMTEHRKAVKNRKRDFEAHHEHVHNYRRDAIAGGVMFVNIAPQFQSTLRTSITTHRNVEALVTHCAAEMRNVNMSGGPAGYGLDAKALIVVNMDNVTWENAAYFTDAPAPRVGDPMHYDAFIQRICSEYTRRFVR